MAEYEKLSCVAHEVYREHCAECETWTELVGLRVENARLQLPCERDYVVRRKLSWRSRCRYLGRPSGGSPGWVPCQRMARRFTREGALAVASVFCRSVAVKLVKK